MTEQDMPQVCVRCHQFKSANLGKLVWDRNRWHTRIFVCYACREKPQVVRLARQGEETPIELEARKALEGLKVKASAEFKIGGFIFDFVILHLRMLIEIDSDTYHRSWKRSKRDSHKTAWAQENFWHLVRIKPPDIAQQVVHAVTRRAQSFR